jgi:hypothetical protein
MIDQLPGPGQAHRGLRPCPLRSQTLTWVIHENRPQYHR